MATSSREKWDRRFSMAMQPNTPAEVLSHNIHLLPQQGRALELACGLGGNGLLLAEHGLQVDAADNSPVALEKLGGFAAARDLTINTLQMDVERDGLPAGGYDVIVCCHYLYRPLCEQMQTSLLPGGLLYYQTFTRNKSADIGPNSPDYLLRRNELLTLFQQLRLVYYREEDRIGDQGRGLRNVACYIGQKSPAA